MLLNARWRFRNILLLSSNDRVSSFYCIRGSKHYILTSFSYLNRYSLFLVFSQNCYLLVSSRLSWLHGKLFLSLFLIPLVLLKKYAHGYLPSLPIFYVFAKRGECIKDTFGRAHHWKLARRAGCTSCTPCSSVSHSHGQCSHRNHSF